MKKKELFWQAIQATVPILIGYLFLGIGFGILFREAGGNAGQALLTAVSLFAGSMQYALVGFLKDETPLFIIALTTLTINGRYFFYSLSILDRFKEAGFYKPFLLFWLSDESYALISNDDDKSSTRFCKWFYMAGLNYSYWVFACFLGALLGQILPFSSRGIEFVMTALFVTIFIDQWQCTQDHIPALSGLFLTALFYLLLPREHFLLATLIVLTIFLLIYGKKKNL